MGYSLGKEVWRLRGEERKTSHAVLQTEWSLLLLGGLLALMSLQRQLHSSGSLGTGVLNGSGKVWVQSSPVSEKAQSLENPGEFCCL